MNMLRPSARLSTAVSIAALIMLCAAAVAQAATATNFDTSYQNGGTLLLPQRPGMYGQVTQRCEVTGTHLSIAGRFGPNESTSPAPWRTNQQLATSSIKLHPRQPMMLGIAQVDWHA